jgi:tetratricopeptide (TPR) repeat protein
MARISRKELKRDEFVEATKEAEHWLEEHWQTVAKIAAAVAGIAILVGIWFWYSSRTREQAALLLDEGLSRYTEVQEGGFTNTAELETALASFDAAARKGGRAAVGQVSRYYREELTGNPNCPDTLAGSAHLLLAELFVAAAEPGRAVQTLETLIDADPPIYPLDQALMALGKVHQANGDEEQARIVWQRVIDEYPTRGSASQARRLLGR